MGKLIRFINHGIQDFFIINGEDLGDGCNEFKNGLPDSFTPDFITFPCHMMAPTVLQGF